MQAFKKEKITYSVLSVNIVGKKIVKQVIVLLTSADEPGSFEKHQQVPTLSLFSGKLMYL